jgi:hypothetical protein
MDSQLGIGSTFTVRLPAATTDDWWLEVCPVDGSAGDPKGLLSPVDRRGLRPSWW